MALMSAADRRRLFADDFMFESLATERHRWGTVYWPQMNADVAQMISSCSGEAFDLDELGAEVEQEADLDAGGLEVVQKFGFVSWDVGFFCLALAARPLVHRQVRVILSDRPSLIMHGNLRLRADGDVSI